MRWLSCPNCGGRVPARAGYRRCPFGCAPVAAPLRAPWSWLWRWRGCAGGGLAAIRSLGWGFGQFCRSLYGLLAAWAVAGRRRWPAVGGTALVLVAVAGYGLRFWPQPSTSQGRQGVSSEAFFVYRSGGEIQQAAFDSGKAVRLTSRDDYCVVVRPVVPYVYTLQQQGSSYWRLFPHEDWSPGVGTPLAVGIEEVFPSGSAWYCLDEAVGEETVHVVMSASPIAELERLPRAAETGGRVATLRGLFPKAAWVCSSFEHARASGGGIKQCAPAFGTPGAGARWRVG